MELCSHGHPQCSVTPHWSSPLKHFAPIPSHTTHFPPHACSLLSSCTEHYTLQAAHQLTQLVTASRISFLRLAFGSRRYSQVHVFVQFGCKVPGHLSTAIVVAVTLGYVIHIMEDQAVPIQVLHGFLKADIEKHGSVKGLGTNLKKTNDLEAKTLLPLLHTKRAPRSQMDRLLSPQRLQHYSAHSHPGNTLDSVLFLQNVLDQHKPQLKTEVYSHGIYRKQAGHYQVSIHAAHTSSERGCVHLSLLF